MSKPADPKPVYLQQSPIDLGPSVYAPMDTGQMTFAYPTPAVTGVVEGEGTHAKVNVRDDVRIPLLGMQLKLKQLHFHSPGEHSLHGVKWPLELHLVHDIVSGQTGMDTKSTLLVLGVFYYGATEGTALPILPKFGQQIQQARAKRQDAGISTNKEEIAFNPNHCLPPQGQRSRFFRYQGSLTSGAHDEIVSWVVFEQAVAVAHSDLEEILEAADQAPWPVQELNRRVVLRSFSAPNS